MIFQTEMNFKNLSEYALISAKLIKKENENN